MDPFPCRNISNREGGCNGGDGEETSAKTNRWVKCESKERGDAVTASADRGFKLSLVPIITIVLCITFYCIIIHLHYHRTSFVILYFSSVAKTISWQDCLLSAQ